MGVVESVKSTNSTACQVICTTSAPAVKQGKVTLLPYSLSHPTKQEREIVGLAFLLHLFPNGFGVNAPIVQHVVDNHHVHFA